MRKAKRSGSDCIRSQIAVLGPRRARIGPGVGARLDALHARRVGDAGDRLQDHRLNPREHRGVHADPDAERNDDDGRQAWHPADHPPRLPHVAHHVVTARLKGSRSVYARPENSRDSVCTLIFSPSLMKSGTRISMPVSSVATFVTLPLAVSPRAPASVDVTVISTCAGNTSPIGLSL